MISTHERFIVHRDGRPIEVVLPVAEFRQLVEAAKTFEEAAITL